MIQKPSKLRRELSSTDSHYRVRSALVVFAISWVLKTWLVDQRYFLYFVSNVNALWWLRVFVAAWFICLFSGLSLVVFKLYSDGQKNIAWMCISVGIGGAILWCIGQTVLIYFSKQLTVMPAGSVAEKLFLVSRSVMMTGVFLILCAMVLGLIYSFNEEKFLAFRYGSMLMGFYFLILVASLIEFWNFYIARLFQNISVGDPIPTDTLVGIIFLNGHWSSVVTGLDDASFVGSLLFTIWSLHSLLRSNARQETEKEPKSRKRGRELN